MSNALTKHDPKNNLTTLDDVDESLLDAMTKGTGLEKAAKEDFSLPFLRLLQSLSPQLSRSEASYVAQARAGDFLNSVTNDLFTSEDGVRVVHCFFTKVYIEWRKRINGGGFVAQYNSKTDAVEQADPDNDIVDTCNHYVLVEGKDGTWSPALISLKATASKMSRDWNTKLQALVHPKTGEKLHGAVKVSRIKSVEKTNEKGRFFVPFVELEAGYTTAPVMKQAFLFYNQLKAMNEAELAKTAVRAQEVEYEVTEEVDDNDPSKPSF